MANQAIDSDTPIFFLGVFSSVMGLIFFLFVILMLPYVLFDATTTVPNVILSVSNWLDAQSSLSGLEKRLIILAPFLLLSGIFFLLSWHYTSQVEKNDKALLEVLGTTPIQSANPELPSAISEPPKSLEDFENRHPALFIFALILLLIGGLILIEYLIGADLL